MQKHQARLFINALSRLISGLERNRGGHQVYRSEVDKCLPSRRNAAGPHYHESWELKIPLKGRLHCRFTEYELDLEENAALLIAPQTIHPETSPLDTRRCPAWLCLLFENGDVRLMLMQNRRAALYFLSSDQKSELTALLGRPANEFCEHIALVLARGGKKAGAMMANKWLALLFASLIKAISLPPVSSPQHEIVSRAIALLNNMSHDSSLSVARMAKMLNISPKYLSVVFRRLTGVTPRRKLIRIRLERAYRSLQTGRFTVKEVAALTGWQNQFYFSNSFRRHYGISPSAVPARRNA